MTPKRKKQNKKTKNKQEKKMKKNSNEISKIQKKSLRMRERSVSCRPLGGKSQRHTRGASLLIIIFSSFSPISFLLIFL
jgi:hypothetical protein